MKSYCLSVFVLAFSASILGCAEKKQSMSDFSAEKARHAMRALATNATMRVIKASYSVRTNLLLVTDRKIRLDLLRDWENLLRDVPVAALSPEQRYNAIREVSDMLNSYVSAALGDAGCDFGEIWELHFRTLAWLDRQVALMKPEGLSCKGLNKKELLEKWDFYQALAEWRETIVENHERFDLDPRVKILGMEKIDEIRHRFESMIGRPVRPGEEIKMLGHYHKIVRKRIEEEKKAALGFGMESEPRRN